MASSVLALSWISTQVTPQSRKDGLATGAVERPNPTGRPRPENEGQKLPSPPSKWSWDGHLLKWGLGSEESEGRHRGQGVTPAHLPVPLFQALPFGPACCLWVSEPGAVENGLLSCLPQCLLLPTPPPPPRAPRVEVLPSAVGAQATQPLPPGMPPSSFCMYIRLSSTAASSPP